MSDNSVGGRRPRRKFTDEFKAEAVRMVDEAGGNVSRVADELTLNPLTLRNWVDKQRAEEAGAPTAEERAEIRELKRELDRVTRERDILGKAVAYFSARDPKNG